MYRPGSVLDIPKRPPWSYKMSKHQVEHQEEDMFESYLHKIHTTFKRKDLSYFEHNLEVIMMMIMNLSCVCLSVCFQTWRQLWRVLELSDVILLITDVRHPVSVCLFVCLYNDLSVNAFSSPFSSRLFIFHQRCTTMW